MAVEFVTLSHFTYHLFIPLLCFIFRKVYWVCKLFKLYSFPSLLLLTGQLSCLAILPISLSLSSCRVEHSNIMWSTVWLPPTQGQSGDSMVLKRWRYALIFPWDVTSAVKFGVAVILVLNVFLMFGKNCFVVAALVVASHCICHFFRLLSLCCCSISLIGILL